MNRNRATLDTIDLKIIEFLEQDSRKNRQEIANQLQISRQTVQKRIAYLEEKGIIKFTCRVDDRFFGKEIAAIILILLDRTRRMWAVTTSELWLRHRELEIVEIHHVTGNFDIILKMKTRTIRSLEEKLAEIAAIEGVSKTQTMVCMSSYDEDHPVGEDLLPDFLPGGSVPLGNP
ncbi:MAG: Lrp/AsnC family transcriptional regulator [Candidatus Odinarchaeota archaeon]